MVPKTLEKTFEGHSQFEATEYIKLAVKYDYIQGFTLYKHDWNWPYITGDLCSDVSPKLTKTAIVLQQHIQHK